MNIRTFQPGDEPAQAALFNMCAFPLPGFKPAQAADVQRRTRTRGFDPACRFYAVEGGQVVGYCTLEPDQGRVGYPWCKKGFEAARPLLFDAALSAARDRGVGRLFAAYRRDWEPVLRFFADQGFAVAREMVNFAADPVDLPTLANRPSPQVGRLRREDLPALADIGRGVIRLPVDRLEAHFFANPYFPAEAIFVTRQPADGPVVAAAIGLEVGTWADVTKVDPLTPCFRMGAFGTEGLGAKKVNGLFSLLARPEHVISAGLGLLSEVSQEMTDGTVEALAAQCPSDAPHLLHFYQRFFKEQGRFPVLEQEV